MFGCSPWASSLRALAASKRLRGRFRASGLGLRVLGFRVLEFRAWGFWVEGLGLRPQDSGPWGLRI